MWTGTGTMWKRSTISDAPAWTTGSPKPATRASLVFRAGVADETPETRGWLAACRDLALAADTPAGVHVRGEVKGLHTTYTISADHHLLPTGIAWLVTRLVRPDLDLLERVVMVRQAEAVQPSLYGQLLRRELGAQGYGMAGFAELGLERLDPSAMRWFTQLAFTTGNVAICFDGAAPDGVTLALPTDERWSPPEPTETLRPRPAVTEVTGTEVGLLSRVPGRAVGLALGHVLTARLAHRVQMRRPGYGGVRSETSRIDLAAGAVLVAASAVEAPAPFLLGSLEAALRDVVESGARPQELIDLVIATHRRVTDPSQHFAILQRAALDDLLGLRALAPADLLEELKTVSAVDVAEVAATVRACHLIGMPEGSPLENPFGFPVDEPVYGRARQSGQSSHPSLCAGRPAAAAYVMPGMIHLRPSADEGLDIPATQIVQLLAYPDGGRVLVTADGFTHAVEPTLYGEGAALVAAIDSMVPADLRFDLPARAEVPQPTVITKDPAWRSVISRVIPKPAVR